jgi:hypothetical protein
MHIFFNNFFKHVGKSADEFETSLFAKSKGSKGKYVFCHHVEEFCHLKEFYLVRVFMYRFLFFLSRGNVAKQKEIASLESQVYRLVELVGVSLFILLFHAFACGDIFGFLQSDRHQERTAFCGILTVAKKELFFGDKPRSEDSFYKLKNYSPKSNLVPRLFQKVEKSDQSVEKNKYEHRKN